MPLKKQIKIGFVGVVASFVLFNLTVFSAEEPGFSFERIFAKAGLNKEGLDFGEGFGKSDEEEIGQDLFAIIYKKTVIYIFCLDTYYKSHYNITCCCPIAKW